MCSIQMVDLQSQYLDLKDQIDYALIKCAESGQYIKGQEVNIFEEKLAGYLNVKHVITCGNGTDALQIAMMALKLKPGDEVIVPAFTYVATAEAIALLGLVPVMVDVEWETFNICVEDVERAITPKTRAIVPVHLYGQSAPMEAIMSLAKKYSLYVIEDNAQALGAECIFTDGTVKKTGTIGHIGCNSFFPTGNLGCLGDGGALTTNNNKLAERCRMISSHGQKRKYFHETIGCNSRLDTLQAAVLNVKLNRLDDYVVARRNAAVHYYQKLYKLETIALSYESAYARHTYNQFTLKVNNGRRDQLKMYLHKMGIPSCVYYPLPLYKQVAFRKYIKKGFSLKNTQSLCDNVLSIPMHTELDIKTQDIVINAIQEFN